MIPQTFSIGDLGPIGTLIVLEGLLSADNAMVLAIMVRHLPKEQQAKALLYGLGGAFILRTIMIGVAAYIIQFWWLQLIGALYLVYLPIKHFVRHASNAPHMVGKQAGFWKTVMQVELVDVAFALDSVLVGVAVVNTARHPDKTWVVIAGGIIGVILLRFAAGYFIRILNQYPVLDHVAYLLVGWSGIKMLFGTGHTFDMWFEKAYPDRPVPIVIHEMPDTIFWIGMALITVIGGYLAFKKGPEPEGVGDSPAEMEEEEAGKLYEDLTSGHATEPKA